MQKTIDTTKEGTLTWQPKRFNRGVKSSYFLAWVRISGFFVMERDPSRIFHLPRSESTK